MCTYSKTRAQYITIQRKRVQHYLNVDRGKGSEADIEVEHVGSSINYPSYTQHITRVR
jgi:hypothetical protein